MVGLRGDTEVDCGSKEFIRRVINAMDDSSSSLAGALRQVTCRQSLGPLHSWQQEISQPGSHPAAEKGRTRMCGHSNHSYISK